MPKDFPRSRRMAEQIKRTVSTIIRVEINDPRVGNVAISEVEVSRDLAHAKVYVVPMFGTKNPAEVIDALNHAAGYIRTELGKQLKARLTPSLNFIHDQSFERADELSRLIDQALASDAGHPGYSGKSGDLVDADDVDDSDDSDDLDDSGGHE